MHFLPFEERDYFADGIPAISMGKFATRPINSFISALCDRMAKMEGIPVDDDDCGEQVKSGDAVILALGGAVTDFSLATDA